MHTRSGSDETRKVEMKIEGTDEESDRSQMHPNTALHAHVSRLVNAVILETASIYDSIELVWMANIITYMSIC